MKMTMGQESYWTGSSRCEGHVLPKAGFLNAKAEIARKNPDFERIGFP